ncbi:MAG: HIT domain-containing protein [Prevotellaceae bacterium]|jgi:histidine triad (HIT) family protein|nr:HIT domain-containing protein [Prevotellaceae bacterium]
MASIFTKIINGEIPSYKIAEDENYYAFLDINPIAKAHTLVVPKKETDYIFDIDDNTLGGLVIFTKRIAKAIEKSVECKRIGVVVLGLEVPHAHIHLVPLNNESDVDFRKPKLQLSVAEFKQIAASIRGNFV